MRRQHLADGSARDRANAASTPARALTRATQGGPPWLIPATMVSIGIGIRVNNARHALKRTFMYRWCVRGGLHQKTYGF